MQKSAAWLSYVAGYISGHTGNEIGLGINAKTGGITDTFKDAVQKAIFAGAEQEEGIPEITARVQDVFGDEMEGWRATRIARSETAEAYNQATLQQGKDNDSHLDIMWIAEMDDATRDAHRDMDGLTIPWDQEDGFDCDDGTSWPGDAPNCRCCIGYAQPEETPEAALTGGGFDSYSDGQDAATNIF